jgi:CubicO group peptidase (beta-lactamase class C family)
MLAEEQLAGVVYSLIDADATRTGAVGLANAERGEALRADSKVHIGSIAKTLVALGVLRLATQERVDLDASLGGLLPGIRFDNPWHSRSPLKLRHLLDHTSGLDDARLWQMFSAHVHPDSPLAGAFNTDRTVHRIRSEPGTQFSYSNMGYALAGMVIEAVTGERYETWLDRELLAPLGMHDSTFRFVSQAGPAADARLAWGHYDDLTPVKALPVWLRPAAQFTTTAGDMARFARFVMSDGRIDGRPFVATKYLSQMGRAKTTAAARAGLEVGYALGLTMRDRHGAVGLCHSGNIVGFRAMLCLYPEQQKAFFVSNNTDSESARYTRFDALLTQTLAVETPLAGSVETSASTAWTGFYVPAPARFEMFRYFEMLFDGALLRVRGQHLVLRRLGQGPQHLDSIGTRLYRLPERRVASHVLLERGGAHFLSDGTHTLRKVSGAWYTLLWVSFLLGIGGLLTLLVAGPLRRMWRKETLLQPANIALMLLAIPLPLFALQPFTALGDRSPASVALFFATLALPMLLIAQCVWSYRNRHRIGWWRLQIVTTLCALQWCGSLYMWDLLPLALWS